MTKQFYILFLAVLATFFVACTASRQVQAPVPTNTGDSLYVTLDTMVILPEIDDDEFFENRVYQAAEERKWDLLHTKLDLSFDWKNEKVIGLATLSLTPVFYNQSILTLDAVNFEIKSITVDEQQIATFQNSNRELIIDLNKAYKKGEMLQIEINYEVIPVETALTLGAAITSDKGLFFIDPQDTIPGKPQQIWTQGETENSSRWFPTLDKPNERGTQEIILTVSDTMMTLSNGILVSSTAVAGGMRRDHWKLDLPHAPYLAMIAVGQWDKVTDYWRGRSIEYYVDPGFGSSARTIFQHTPEMLEFFSTKLGYDFVWPKYAQLIVKDFVTGAMENSSAVIYGDFVQFKKDDVIEEGINDYIVSHELFHQWFGDLVTCASWSNLALNEGFANYGEYLWQEYKYGKEQADITRINELSGYFNQAEHEVHPLVDYYYEDKQDMFDAHTYNKGGLVLHMLRGIVGDEAFFASLQLYLINNEYSAVEVTDLRKAFESTTGLDLHWFFDQWYFGTGHPVLTVTHDYNATEKQVYIDIEQTQGEQGFTDVFTLPMEIAIVYPNRSIVFQQIKLDRKNQRFILSVDGPPAAVIVDPNDLLLAVVQHDMAQSEYPVRALAPISINHRLSAFRMMEEINTEFLNELLVDSSYTMRLMAISYLVEQGDWEMVYAATMNENRPEIQYYVLEAMAKVDPYRAKAIAVRLLDRTDKVPMIYSALMTVAAIDIDEAIHWVAHFENNQSDALYVARASIYAREYNALTPDFFYTDRAFQISDDYLEELIATMAMFLSTQNDFVQDEGLRKINSTLYLQTQNPEYRRFFLITGLLRQYVLEEDVIFQEKILTTINSLYQKESSPYLKSVLKEGLGDLLD